MTRLAGIVLVVFVGVCSTAYAQGVTQIQGTSPLRPEPPKPADSQAPRPPASSSGDLFVTFDGADLPRDWKIVNPDAARWTTQPRKSVLLISQKSPCPNSKDGKNLLLLDK